MFCHSFFFGIKFGYYSGDPLLLLDDIKVLKPTNFATVPRILNRVYGKIMEGVQGAGGLKKWMFENAVETKKKNLLTKGQFTHAFYDKVVFKKVRELFGGNIRIMLTASAPISGDVLTFFKIALGVHIYEVYGQTENSGPATCTMPSDPTAGHVGGIGPNLKMRLRDVPEMGYLATDEPPRGEV